MLNTYTGRFSAFRGERRDTMQTISVFSGAAGKDTSRYFGEQDWFVHPHHMPMNQ
jgi:hypothetical protein